MLELADRAQLELSDLPTPDGQADGMAVGRYAGGLAHSYLDNSFLPVVAGGEVLLVRIGTAGWGDHFGSARLFSAYRLRDDTLEPVAGLYLDVGSRTLADVRVNGST